MRKCLIKFSLLLFLAMSSMVFTPSCDDNNDQISEQQEIPDKSIKINSGCLPLPTEEYEKIPFADKISSTKAYPASVTLDCPPILHQGGEGSCVAWAVGYAARSISWKNLYGGTYNNNSNIFSPEYIYNQIKTGNCTSGSFAKKALDLIKDQGVCVWDDMPYTDTDCDLYPNTYQVQQAANYKITGYSRVSITLDSFKDQLAAGKPIVVCGSMCYQFIHLSHGQIHNIVGWSHGQHCYCCVGYDDSKNAFLVMNSWGTNWGTDGFGWISYDIMEEVWREAYVLNE